MIDTSREEPNRRGRLVACSTLALGVALATAAPAYGQVAAAEAAQRDPEAAQATETPTGVQDETAEPDAGEIIVTGSRVQRDGFTAPTPTTVLGAELIAQTAPANLADVVNQLPALSTGLSPRVGNLGTSTGQGGLNVLNLRALGPTRTLVLLDGRRVAGSTSTGVVDINTIPQQLVERVDVVTGGASAAYGSDAVTGVINFVLNKDFNGLLLDAQVGLTDEGDGATRKFSASFGTDFANGRGHFVIAGEYSDQEGIFETRSRDWFNGSKLVANPVAGGPRRIYAENVNLSTATGGGLIIRDARNGPLQGIQFGPGGAPRPFQFGTQSGTANLMIGGERNDIAAFIPLAADVKNRNVFARLSYEVLEGVTAFAEGSYGTSDVFNPAVHQFKLGNLTIQRDNAFLPESIRAQMTAAGLTQLIYGTWNQDIGKLEVVNEFETYRVVGGIDAKLGGSWTLNGYYQYGRTNAYNAVENQTITARYNQAIDAVRDASGNIACRNPANGCVPLNIIGTGVASQAAIDWLTGTPERDSKIEQHVAALSVQGEPFSTWAGPVSVAVGGEYRKESTAETVDPLSLTSSYFSGNFKPVNGSYDVKEGFLEVVVPLAKDVPFAQALDLNGAVRATEYSTSGFVTTWKVGATWKPFNDLLIRAVRSRDIRAPNIADLFANVQVTQTVTDPFNGGRTDTVAAFLSSGNPDLAPERANNLGVGAVFSPNFLPGFQVSLDYYRIDIDGAITTLASSSQQAVDLCFRGISAICPLITRDGGGRITAIRLAGVNAGTLKTSGFDIEGSYRTDIGAGRLTVRGLLNLTEELVVDTGVTRKDYAGEVANQTSPFGALAAYFPDLQGSLSVTYQQGGFTGFLRGRYIGEGVVDNTFTPADISRNEVPSVAYLDGTVSYKFEGARGSPEFYLAVDNILDKEPPTVAPLAANPFLSTGTSPGLYDAIGRSFRIGVRGKF